MNRAVAWVNFIMRSALVVFAVAVFAVVWYSSRPAVPSVAVKVAIDHANQDVQTATAKVAAVDVQVKHAKAVVKVKAKLSAEKRAVYEAAKSLPGSGGNPAAVGDRPGGASPGRIDLSVPALQKSVAPTPELPAPVAEVIATADAALDASHAENAALQEVVATLDVAVAVHVEKETALERKGELADAVITDLKDENAVLQKKLFWTHVAIGVAVVFTAVGGLYLIGVL